MSDTITETNETTRGKGFIKKLKDGDFGLAKTFWVYGILVSFIVLATTFMNVISQPILKLGFALSYCIYQVYALIGTWKAANRYRGYKVWSILAKVHVAFGAIGLVFAFIALAIGGKLILLLLSMR